MDDGRARRANTRGGGMRQRLVVLVAVVGAVMAAQLPAQGHPEGGEEPFEHFDGAPAPAVSTVDPHSSHGNADLASPNMSTPPTNRTRR